MGSAMQMETPERKTLRPLLVAVDDLLNALREMPDAEMYGRIMRACDDARALLAVTPPRPAQSAADTTDETADIENAALVMRDIIDVQDGINEFGMRLAVPDNL